MTVSEITTYLLATMFLLGLIAVIVGAAFWRRLRREHVGGLILILTMAAVIFVPVWFAQSGTVIYLTQSYTCVFCHEMNPEYRTWAESRHGNINCLACHLPVGGPATLLEEDVRNIKELVDHFTGDYPQIINQDSHVSKEMESNVCERCHNMFSKRQIEIRTVIKMDHPKHLRLKITCQSCHNRITHLGARGYSYFNGMTMMEGCMRCHTPGEPKKLKGKTAPTDCRTCHRQPNWAVTVFGKEDIAAEDFTECRACHRVRNSKVVNEYDSSKMAAKEIQCVDCHNQHRENFNPKPEAPTCTECHAKAPAQVISGKMGFKGYKPPFKKESEVRCMLCHRPHTFKAVKPR